MKRFKRHITLLFFSTALLSSVCAQRAYTLDECVNAALQNNVRMKNANNDLMAAKHTRKQAFTKYFPSVSATGGGFMANKGILQMDMPPEDKLSVMKNGVVGGVSAAIPLFTGGQIHNSNKLAEIGVETKRLMLRQSENEIRLATEKYFWQIVILKEKLHTLSAVEEQLNSISKDVEAAVDAGVTNRNDLLQIHLRSNETESGRIQLENALATSRSMLAQYTGLSADSMDVAADFREPLPQSPAALYRIPETSLPLTNEYHLLEQNVRASRLQHKIAIGKFLPNISIGGGYMYHNLMDKDHPFWVGFATVSVPLSGWWGGSHEIKKQRLQLRNAENLQTDNNRLLLIRMQNSWNNLNEAYRQIGIALESISQSEENLRLQTDYYHAGTCTMSDLLEAQTIYRQSRDRYTESRAGYEVKKQEYLQATGR